MTSLLLCPNPQKIFCKNVLFQASGCIAMPKEGLVDHCQSHNHEVWQLILETLKEQWSTTILPFVTASGNGFFGIFFNDSGPQPHTLIDVSWIKISFYVIWDMHPFNYMYFLSQFFTPSNFSHSFPLPSLPPPTFPLFVTCYLQTDLRESNVMRVAPAPLYNSFTDVFRMYTLLQQAMERN